MSNVTKLITALSIVLLVSVSLFVATNVNGDNDDEIDTVYLDDLKSGNPYWVKATEMKDEEEDTYYELSPNGTDTKPCYVMCGVEGQDEVEWFPVQINKDLTIPKDSGLYSSDAVVISDSTLTVKGTYYQNAAMRMMYGENYATASAEFQTTTISRATTVDNSTVIVDGGYFAPLAINFTSESKTVSYVQVINSGVIGSTCPIICGGMSVFALSDLTTVDNEKGFKFGIDGKNFKTTLTGTFIGTGVNSYMAFLNKGMLGTEILTKMPKKMELILDDVDFYNIKVDFGEFYGVVTIKDSDKLFSTLGNNVQFYITYRGVGYNIADMMRTANGEVLVSMLVTTYEGASPVLPVDAQSTKVSYELSANSFSKNLYAEGQSMGTTIMSTDLYCALFGTQGKISSYNYISLQGSEGIESINVDSEYAIGDLIFLKSGLYNLNDIEVKCRSGYSFDGWYYLDLDGKECKVLDPENFLVTENMTIYAKATQNQPDYGGYFIAIIAILIIMAIVALAYMILKGRGIIGY